MSAFHSPRGRRRQSGRSRIHMRFCIFDRPPRPLKLGRIISGNLRGLRGNNGPDHPDCAGSGLASSARIYAPVIPALWRFGPVMVANHIRDDSMAAIAARVLSEAPPRFALAGHSMGGYIALEIMRQAPE